MQVSCAPFFSPDCEIVDIVAFFASHTKGGTTAAFSQREHSFSFIHSGSEASELHGPDGEPVFFGLYLIMDTLGLKQRGSEGPGRGHGEPALVIAFGDPGQAQLNRFIV